MRNCHVAALVAALLYAGTAAALTPAQKCEKVVVKTLRRCVKSVNTLLADCYANTGAACAPNDFKVAVALDRMADKVLNRCPDAATVAAAGYGAAMTPAALVARLQEACLSEPAALAARSFGGPHGLALADADATQRACLLSTYDAGARLVERTFKAQTGCVLRAHKGKPCDAAAVQATITGYKGDAIAFIAGECGATLPTLVALDASTFAATTSEHVGCLSAAALGAGASPLELGCGARAAVVVPPRDTPTQVVLDEATWGTRCGNGSPYAFQLRLAPAGQPVEKVIIHLQGGGVCLTEADCSTQPAGLFIATDDALPGGGSFSVNPVNNPAFANWTKVFLPYCTQDLHIGGGGVSAFPGLTVNRFGARNVRAALRYVRDVLWQELNATTADGYRPDRLQVLFSGTSAGGYGVLYNYHYVLDELRWVHATAVPDAALALHNGAPVGVQSLAVFMFGATPPNAWESGPFFPPYCFGAGCVVGPVMETAHAARLLAQPEQQILHVSNQVDNVQVSTTLFPNLVSWINALRVSYCALQGTAGLHSFLAANTSSIHGTLLNNQFTNLTANGVALRDWLGDAATNPPAVVDAVSEGTLVSAFGANPFTCPVGP